MDPTTAALFPNSFGDDGLPVGWWQFSFGDLAKLKNGFAFKSANWADDGVPVIKIGSVKPGLIELIGGSFVSDEVARGKKQFRIEAGAAAIGLTGYVGEVGRVPPTLVSPLVNQRVARIDPSDGSVFSPFVYTLARSQEFKEFVLGKSYGSAQANVSTKDISTFPIRGTQKLIEEYNGMTNDLFERQLLLIGESQTLATLRNTLLPRLMSGELRIRDAEQQVEEVV
jgi:type I restriction enzyme S subunit